MGRQRKRKQAPGGPWESALFTGAPGAVALGPTRACLAGPVYGPERCPEDEDSEAVGAGKGLRDDPICSHHG